MLNDQRDRGPENMNESDLRVIKIKESIDQAFLSLFARKPLGKISIVELAREESRINKGTFYLHFMLRSELSSGVTSQNAL